MKKQLINYTLLLLIITGSITLHSCEKPAPEEDPRILQIHERVNLKPGGDIKTVCWNIYSVAKQIYLWKLPSVAEFNPEQYVSGDTTDKDYIIGNLLLAIRKPTMGADQWSSITTPAGKTISKKRNYNYFFTTYNNIGVTVRINDDDEEELCALVDAESPAGQAGVARGDLLLTKGRDGSYTFSSRKLKRDVIVQPNPIYDADPISYCSSFTVKKENGIDEEVGYLMYRSFNHRSKESLNKVFNFFYEKTVSTLIIDLRYNSGGFVSNLKHLLNLILPSHIAQNKLLTVVSYNPTLGNNTAFLLKDIFVNPNRSYFDLFEKDIIPRHKSYFSKAGNLETVKRIYFIVSENTSSLSENLINAFKPFSKELPMKIIGKTTRGKGVGSYPIVVNGYELNLILSQILNANLEAVSVDGINPDINVPDNLNYTIGDLQEPCLKAAIADIKKGSCLGCNMF